MPIICLCVLGCIQDTNPASGPLLWTPEILGTALLLWPVNQNPLKSPLYCQFRPTGPLDNLLLQSSGSEMWLPRHSQQPSWWVSGAFQSETQRRQIYGWKRSHGAIICCILSCCHTHHIRRFTDLCLRNYVHFCMNWLSHQLHIGINMTWNMTSSGKVCCHVKPPKINSCSLEISAVSP